MELLSLCCCSQALRTKIVGRRANGLVTSLEGWKEVVGLVLRASAKTGFAANIDATGSFFAVTARSLEALTALLLSSQPQ